MMYLANKVDDLIKIGLSRDIAISINDQLVQNGRASINLKKNTLTIDVSENPYLISGYKITSEKNTTDNTYIDLVIERTSN